MARLSACPIQGVWLFPFNFVGFVGLKFGALMLVGCWV